MYRQSADSYPKQRESKRNIYRLNEYLYKLIKSIKILYLFIESNQNKLNSSQL